VKRRGRKRTEYRIEAHLFVRALNEKEAQKFNERFQQVLRDLVEHDFKWKLAFTGGHAEIEPLD